VTFPDRSPAIRLSCVVRDETRARELADDLSNAGFDVTIETRLIGADPHSGEDQRLCTIVLWSRASIENWAVVDMARAAMDAGKLVQVTLDGTRRDDLGTDAPIDFRSWAYGDRGNAWRRLRERLDNMKRGAAQTGAPLTALLAMGALSAGVVGIALSERIATGEFTVEVNVAAAQSAAEADFIEVVNPAARIDGLAEETDDLDPAEDFRFHRMRAPPPMRVNQVTDLPNIEAPSPMGQAQLQRPGFLRRVLNVAEDSIPFVGSSGSEERSAR
jgi:hypothetical protein